VDSGEEAGQYVASLLVDESEKEQLELSTKAAVKVNVGDGNYCDINSHTDISEHLCSHGRSYVLCIFNPYVLTFFSMSARTSARL
jgi:hypothetical protein